MWKYTGVKECNDFLLSLNLLNCNDNKKYIRTLYTLANNQNKNYKDVNVVGNVDGKVMLSVPYEVMNASDIRVNIEFRDVKLVYELK